VVLEASLSVRHNLGWPLVTVGRRLNTIVDFARTRRVQTSLTLGLVLLGPLLAFVTFLILGPYDLEANAPGLRLIVLADLIYVLVLTTLVLRRLIRVIGMERTQAVGARLHLRLTGVFAVMALLPTISVAVFGVLTINIGLETWFSERVRNVVGASLAAAEAYQAEHRVDLSKDARSMALAISAARRQSIFVDDGELRQLVGLAQARVQRGLREAFVVDGTGDIRARGEQSYLFDFERPEPQELEVSRKEGLLIIEDWSNDEIRALVPLSGFANRFLYVSRDVDGDLLNLLDDTKQTAQFYQQQESERGRRLFDFALLYLGFALLLIMAAIWLGLWFAERLSGPVGVLAGAAQRVGSGDLDVHVRHEKGDDEIAMLGRYFNQMTRQLKVQRDTLLDNTRQIEKRQRIFDSVLGSVTSGVLGLDDTGRVDFVNRSGERLLDWRSDKTLLPIHEAVPEFGALFDRLRASGLETAQEEIRLVRAARLENLLVRISTRRRSDEGLEGYVVAFDDVTDLVSAQRTAAWGDVARRIAHEIKNPLTPIQLSAERIKRKFHRALSAADAERLDQMTEVIVRQTGDLRRIVDEFSQFARMPQPQRRTDDLVELMRSVTLLQDSGQPDVLFNIDLPDAPVMAPFDATMIGQAISNLLKNAGEAIETLRADGEAPDSHRPQINVSLTADQGWAEILISDNGTGLPPDRARLFEPYVTTRDTGTGLGLPIVKKIIEEHGGSLILDAAPLFGGADRPGAQARIRLPRVLPVDNETTNKPWGTT
jgi:two-component system nitrogen regulation sensor histidine kinase NtrY